jgi:predicted acyl esterase
MKSFSAGSITGSRTQAAFDREPRIRYFALGPNEWRSPDDGRKREFPLYLHSGGNANSRKGDGTLSPAAHYRREPRDVFVYDPEVPVVAPGGPQSERPIRSICLGMGNNLLVYTSEPVAARMPEIFGRPRIRLYAATSAPHADFTAKLVRVTPSGRAEFLSIGIARSSWLFRTSGYSRPHVTRGSSRSSQFRLCSLPASACALRSQAPPSRSTIATPPPVSRRRTPTTGTGRAPRSKFSIPAIILPRLPARAGWR